MAVQKKIDKKNPVIITTHMNADFDAVASMLAAQKLYPDAYVVFPGSQERNIRNFFINSMVYLFNMAEIKDIDFDSVEKLILVDTRQPNRIGKFASLLKRGKLQIYIYDHHPPAANDIEGDLVVHRQTGATVTLLTEIIQQKELHVSADEATVMCLGLYEDTGSFTFPSTTVEDFQAAAFLLSKGANLNLVSDLISKEISPQQVEILNEMIQSAARFNINGVEILMTSITSGDYVPDFAFLVHKLVKMENIDAVFAIARMENKIYVVARSRIPEVDVGQIIKPLEGGGHTFAAAATIKGKTLAQVENQLLGILHQKVRSRQLAKDLMSAPPITVDFETTCIQARKLLNRYNINALLVIRSGEGKEELLGFISRQIIEKALHHELDQVQVQEYMTTDIASVGPEADIYEIQDKIIESSQRILPIISKGQIIGVVTRTDLLNTLVRRSQRDSKTYPESLENPIHARTRNITKFMNERLSDRLLKILKSLGEVANELSYGAYLIGGFVRDLFLYRGNEDIDVVIEGDGIAFAKKFAQIAGARIHSYQKFGTAVVIFPDNFKIDVASARLEYYKFPAAMPTVKMSSIKLDLFRRDFTINTLAIQLNTEKFGTLIDFFSAQKDVKEKVIRVLHNLSFVEDPTRVFRAIRFEQRFNFTIGKLTLGLIHNAVKMDFFKRLSGRRVFTEIRQIMEEEIPVPAIVRLNDFGLLEVIHPSIKLDNALIALFNSARKVISWHDLLFLEEAYIKWIVYFMVLLNKCDLKISEQMCHRFELAQRYKKIICVDRFEADQCIRHLEKKMPKKSSRLFKFLSRFKIELILYMMAVTKSKKVKKAISYYVTHLRDVRISIRGLDLKKLGLRPGPIYREVFVAVHDAKLDNQVKTRRDEIEFVRNYLSP